MQESQTLFQLLNPTIGKWETLVKEFNRIHDKKTQQLFRIYWTASKKIL